MQPEISRDTEYDCAFKSSRDRVGLRFSRPSRPPGNDPPLQPTMNRIYQGRVFGRGEPCAIAHFELLASPVVRESLTNSGGARSREPLTSIPCHLPLLHILVEERVGERRLHFPRRFMGNKGEVSNQYPWQPLPIWQNILPVPPQRSEGGLVALKHGESGWQHHELFQIRNECRKKRLGQIEQHTICCSRLRPPTTFLPPLEKHCLRRDQNRIHANRVFYSGVTMNFEAVE